MADAVGAEIFHDDFLSSCFNITLIVRETSSVVLPRERSARGTEKPCRIGPAIVKPPKRSKDLYNILPEFRSGVIRTLACPIRGLSGVFLAATLGLVAASSCISPSMSQSGWFAWILVITL